MSSTNSINMNELLGFTLFNILLSFISCGCIFIVWKPIFLRSPKYDRIYNILMGVLITLYIMISCGLYIYGLYEPEGGYLGMIIMTFIVFIPLIITTIIAICQILYSCFKRCTVNDVIMYPGDLLFGNNIKEDDEELLINL